MTSGAARLRRIRLLRILAPVVNGIDLSKFRNGDIILVPEAVACMLIKENWAELVPEPPPADQVIMPNRDRTL